MRKKLIFLSLLFGFTFLPAKMVNEVVATVENEPITKYEIYEVMKKTGADEKAAFEMLINSKLKDAQIKKMGIIVPQSEIQKAFESIAKKNNMSVEEFKKVLKKQGIQEKEFKDRIKKQLEEERLFAPIIANIKEKITPENVERFYKSHPELFTICDEVTLTRYNSKNRLALEKIKANPRQKVKGVRIQKGTLKTKQMNNSLMYIVSKTKTRSFSPILTSKMGYDMFYINSKKGEKLIDFKTAQKAAIEAYAESQRERAVRDFNERLRSEATINIIKR